MEISLKKGIDRLVFGMEQKDVEALYGSPDREYSDEDENIIYLYNDKKLRLTFYEDEEFRLGYIIGSHTDLQLFGNSVISESWDTVHPLVKEKGIKSFENEVFDSQDNFFNEENWIIFTVEFGEIVKVELGAVISDKDEFDWKFKA
ncbi:MAG: hypothetical protein BM557_05460 [Flavobacterium sp. MedPE-SWcel]|uniref:hypothetical protein n=1 Tax=uncultured Flavobacterium sp. TaxID=165435 RepID=UPI00091529E5|nr:hypothetical protein [uncultured Flavobacterium sp.]OIQ20119.1 MAG: hypothetical protein BM557_05460 [Flavobacterium sp. MedPE-SWcel]